MVYCVRLAAAGLAFFPWAATAQNITLSGVTRSTSLVVGLATCDRYFRVDAVQIKKFHSAFMQMGNERFGRTFERELSNELARRAEEIRVTGSYQWCRYQKGNREGLGYALVGDELQTQSAGGNALLARGEAWLVIASRPTLEEAVQIAREYVSEFPAASVGRSAAGSYAIAIGWQERKAGRGTLVNLKSRHRVPADAFLMQGERLSEISWTNVSADRASLAYRANATSVPLISSLGLVGTWARSLAVCTAENGMVLKVDQKSYAWTGGGECQVTSAIRERGGVTLSANCGTHGRIYLSRPTNGMLTGRLYKSSGAEESLDLVDCSRAVYAQGGGSSGSNPQKDPEMKAPAAKASAQKSSGTGIVVSSEGHIVSNHHVIEGCSTVEVAGYGPAAIVRSDEGNDLALLRVNTPTPTTPVKIRPTSIRLGQDVVAFGFPLSSLLDNGMNVTTGIVSSLTGIRNDTRAVQFTAAIQPGNSGGPLVDRAGNLLGIVQAKFSDRAALDKGNFVPQSLNFGIKADLVLSFLRANNLDLVQGSDQVDRSVADLADDAKKYTVLLRCN